MKSPAPADDLARNEVEYAAVRLHVVDTPVQRNHDRYRFRTNRVDYPSNSFIGAALELIKYTEIDVRSGSKSRTLIRDYRHRLNCYCISFFGKTAVAKVNHRMLKEFQLSLIEERDLSGSTVRTIVSFVSMVLRHAADEDLISHIPRIPRPSQKDCPRPSFSWDEYQRLLTAMKGMESATPPVTVRAWPITSELREFSAFMVNSFLRPGDALALRHRDVEIKRSPAGNPYLKLTPPTSKTRLDPVVTMPKAVTIYEGLRAKAAAQGKAGPDDFVFLPDRTCRAFAMEILRRQFMFVLEETGLATNNLGQSRTVYSLRHTAIMFRLLHGDVDLLTLARACRTSVEMIDRFYARPLQAEMNIDRIHKIRPGMEFAAE